MMCIITYMYYINYNLTAKHYVALLIFSAYISNQFIRFVFAGNEGMYCVYLCYIIAAEYP